MAKKRPPTFEQKKAAQLAAFAKSKPVTSEVPVEAPQPQKPAAPPQAATPPKPRVSASGKRIVKVPPNHPRARQAAQTAASGGALARPTRTPQNTSIKPAATPKGVDVKAEIDSALRPWSQRPDMPWGGSKGSVGRFRLAAQDLHESIRRSLDTPMEDQIAEARRELNIDEGEAWQFVNQAREGKRFNRFDAFDLIETPGREGLWGAMLDASGNPIVGGNGLPGAQIGDTDLFSSVRGSTKGIDVQDIFSDKPERVRLGLRMGIRGDGKRVFDQAAGSDTLFDIFRRMPGKPDKLTHHTTGRLRGQRLRPGKEKDYLVGGLYDRAKDSRGRAVPANPRLFRKGYAVNLETVRNNLFGETKDSITDRFGSGVWDSRPGNFGLDFTPQQLKELGDGDRTLTELISPEVQADIRRRGGSFYGGIPEPWVKGLKTNWRGGVGATVLNGASREAGVKLGQGDYAGAATEFGTTYGLGAAFEHGVKGLTKSLGKRAPGIVTRFAGGTSGSGGLLGPVMATVAAVEVADGIVEGVTGKDTIAHVNDGIVKPYYQRTTGDTRSEEQIQANLSGPKRVFGSDKPKPTKPQLSKEAVARASAHLTKMVPEVSPEPPTPTVTPTVKPAAQPVKARGIAGAWRRRRK